MRAGRPLAALALAAALGAGWACAPRSVVRDGVRVSVARAVDDDLRESRARLAAGDAEAARVRLERMLDELPAAPRRDEALFLLAESYQTLGQPDQALRAWQQLIDAYPRSPRAAAARLHVATHYREQGRPELAREVLRAAAFGRASDEERVAMYRVLADLARELEDWPDTVRWLAYAQRELADPEQVREIELEVDDLLEGRLSDAQIDELADQLPRGPVYDRLLLTLARRALDRGDADAALQALEALPRRLREQDELLRDALLAEARAGADSALRVVGLAVPLSGPYAPFGASVLRGVALGFGLYEDVPASYRIVVRDTEGDPERAERVVRELADEGVAAIIGPLRSATAVAAAPVAQQLGIPLLTLAQREDLPFLGDYIFRLGLTASDQARELVDFAIGAGQRRFAVIYPRDEYGIQFKNLFWDEVERRGGEIVGAEGYERGAVDWQVEIKKLVGLYFLSGRERELIAERDRLARRPAGREARLAELEREKLPPYVDFDALFIPDEARTVGLVLPQLRLYDVRDVTLLGSSDWNDPTLLEIAGRDARGAVFADAFFARSSYPFVQEFVSRFYSAYGDEPDRLAAEGFDAAGILRALMEDRRHISRESVRRELIALRDFPGVSGLTSFDEDGGTRKSLYLLTVRGDQIEELNGAR